MKKFNDLVKESKNNFNLDFIIETIEDLSVNLEDLNFTKNIYCEMDDKSILNFNIDFKCNVKLNSSQAIELFNRTADFTSSLERLCNDDNIIFLIRDNSLVFKFHKKLDVNYYEYMKSIIDNYLKDFILDEDAIDGLSFHISTKNTKKCFNIIAKELSKLFNSTDLTIKRKDFGRNYIYIRNTSILFFRYRVVSNGIGYFSF